MNAKYVIIISKDLITILTVSYVQNNHFMTEKRAINVVHLLAPLRWLYVRSSCFL